MKPQIDYARIFRAAARMEDTGKARQLLNVVAAAAGKPSDMGHLADKTHAEHFKKRKDDIDHLHRELKNELRMVQSEVSRKLRRHFTHADIKSASGFEFLFDPETLAADLADILAGTLPDMLMDAGQDVYEGFLPPPEEAQAFITERENLMSNVAQETFDSVKAELQDGLDKGETYRELSKRLSAKFDEINEGRAATVASTEVASAYGYARNEAMKQSGAKFKLWVGSGRPPGTLHGMRPAHAAAHYEGQTVAIDEPFRVGGARLMFPTDSSLGAGPELTINCHCVALPAEGPIKGGDVPGHEFHGNQYTEDIRSRLTPSQQAASRAAAQSPDDFEVTSDIEKALPPSKALMPDYLKRSRLPFFDAVGQKQKGLELSPEHKAAIRAYREAQHRYLIEQYSLPTWGSHPVNARAVEKYGIKLPEGYAREGDLYVKK